MKITTNPPVPVKPNVVVEMTYREAQIVRRVMAQVLVDSPEGRVTYDLYNQLGKLNDGIDAGVPRPSVSSRYLNFLTFAEDDK